jgi:hypothetical protein
MRPSLEQRFHEGYVPVTETGCWLWLRSSIKSHGGQRYGELTTHVNGKRGRALAHRLSYELHNGPIPDGIQVCHTCDIGLCVNPAHLFLGSNRDNQLDMVNKGRQGNQKLTPALALAIYRRAKAGENQRILAEEFGIGQQSVSSIATGKIWGHVTGERKWPH